MINYYEGTVFNIKADAIVNTINTVGVMGAGLALEMSLRYPDMYEDYVMRCNNKEITVGKMNYYINDNIKIINFPTKKHFKYPSQIEWIEAGLKDFVKTYKSHNITSVAFPKLGTLNGGLNWIEVRNLMEKYLYDLDIMVYICMDEKKEAEGLERLMLNDFNKMSIEELSENIKLNKKQKINIENLKPYRRFFTIVKIEGVGAKTYSEIFKFFYNRNK